MTVWCVRHRGGWCALKPLRRDPQSVPVYKDNEETQCDHYVTLPQGYEPREPDCAECLVAMKKRAAR